MTAGSLTPIGFVERPTLKYRQHSAQQIGGKKLGLKDLYKKAREVGPAHFRLDYERFKLARERLGSLASALKDARMLSRVDGKVEHQRRRLAIAESPLRWKRVLWSLTIWAWASDLERNSPTCTHFIKDMLF